MAKYIRFLSICVLATVIMVFLPVTASAESENPKETYYFDEDQFYKIKSDKGFSLDAKEKLKENDVHYGWHLGALFVSGYTQLTYDDDGNPVFLKNAGDQVVLGFKLEQDIDKLNGDETLSIAHDKKGYDDYFKIKKTDFKRGALIIRHTDYQNAKSEPQLYTDYLSAKAEVNANTVVELNEEGDYEVALDYVVKSAPRKFLGKEFFPSTSDYTIRLFRFSVRNGNSMIFPFDVKTGEELSNKSFTENGFRIDLAKSHYLKVFVKRDVLDGDDNEDTRGNKPAKDGATYTKEGVYTIEVEDPSTGKITPKKIYVGSDERYKAYVTTGLTLEEIDEKLSDGATVAEDGTIIETTSNDTDVDSVIDESDDDEVKSESADKGIPFVPVVIAIAIVGIIAGLAFSKGHKEKSSAEGESEDNK